MNSIRRILLAVVTSVAISGAARADSITYDATPPIIHYPGDISLLLDVSPTSGTLTVPQWNPADYPGQFLNSIDITVQASVHPTYNIRVVANFVDQNTIGALVPFTFAVNANINLELPDSTTIVDDSLFSTNNRTIFAYTAQSEINLNEHLLDGIATGTSSQTYTSQAYLAPFTGNGNIVMPLTANGGITIVPPFSDVGYVTNLGPENTDIWFDGRASASVTYNWSTVPEPGSFVLAAFGFPGLAAWCWRRRNHAG